MDWTISAVGHVAAIVMGLVTYTGREQPPRDAVDWMPVSIVTESELTQMMRGQVDAPKAETPKPVVDTVGEIKPAEQTAPPISQKPEVKPIPQQTPPEAKAAEQKPDVKPDKKEPPKTDPIADAIKKDEAKRTAEAKAKAKADAAKKQPKFDADQIAVMLNKRDPQRNAATGDEPNQTATLGAPKGSAAMLSQSEVDALRSRLMQLWNPPAGASNPEELMVRVRIKLGRDRKLAGPPIVMTSGRGSLFEAARDGAIRALFQGQPYEMLKPEHFDLWKEMEITFDPREMS